METALLKSFATWARRELITQISARLTTVLAPASPERVENQRAVTMLERDITATGGGTKGKDAVADKVAYTWFNRIIALRFMDANRYTGVGVVSPAHGQQNGQPEVLADAKRGSIDPTVISNKQTRDTITGLLDGTRSSTDAQGEAYTLLLAEYCRYWNRAMPFMFEREGDYTELLIPANLLAADSVLTRAATVLTEVVCRDVEVIGWLYQFYISERKDEVFAGFKRGNKAGATDIPAATQLFTPHWIVRYLVENSLGRLWMLNHPSSQLVKQMDYYIAPIDEETDFLRLNSPEELKVIDPACGSGHMLTYAFDLLYAIYEEEGYAPSEIPELILIHNLYGTEIDPRAGSLAAFALAMKARAKRRTFFNKQVQPNICVLNPISFTPDEIELLLTPGGDREAESVFWNQFQHSDTLGSLVRPDPGLTTLLKQRIARLDDDGDILLAALLNRAKRAVTQAEFLAPRHTVVVANPPYMGAGNMGSALASYAKNAYPTSKTDLFAMFIETCMRLASPSGYVAMITMQSWMFLASFERLRERILLSAPPSTMVHLGERAFDSIGGAVVSTTAFVLQLGRSSSSRGTYVRAVEERTESEKAQTLLSAAAGDPGPLFTSSGATFSEIPGTPIVYWLPDDLRHAFTLGKPLGNVAELREGLSSSDADRFVRMWWEVSTHSRLLDAPTPDAAKMSGAKWFPFNKGGDFRKWYGNQEHVINWQNGGAEILAERPKSTVRSPQFYFRPCVSWSKISTGSPAFRRYPQGFVLGSAAKSVYASSEQEATLLMGICNSSLVQLLLEAKSPTMSFVAEDVGSIPVLTHTNSEELLSIVNKLHSNSKTDWDESENSWDFTSNPLVASANARPLGESFEEYGEHWRKLTLRQQELEKSNNEAIAELYNLGHEVQPDVPLERVTLKHNPAFRYSGKPKDQHDSLFRQDTVKDLVSYAVGCMFGRFSLDEQGLILADQGATVQDYLSKVPTPTFMPDTDNVLPIVDGDWFEDDIVVRFRQFLRTAFGDQHFEENLRFIEESLGVKSLREYFITRAGRSKFYDDHVKRYKKRPIYWLFSSAKGSFNALVYMHRYTPSTASTVLSEYLRDFKSKLEANLQHQERLAAGDGTPREKAAALKEAEWLHKVLLELGEYEHDVLYPLASQQIAIDLDDGVKANYPKFYPALKKITGLEAANE
ncbi:BREX-1 system adenine-specific DNA-methyltransferase PglX [Nocardiopsis sp. M1B1]|uniref:BREX-1 system adenine-specific DNA-methyltransferase PglX n=1 Tax=Nocardiopsis sp. M1B1 TaxID=3450454 RepID=UPI004039D30C